MYGKSDTSNALSKDRHKAKKRAVILSVLLVVGIPLTVCGGVFLGTTGAAWAIVLLVAGIICVVAGFYGTPLAWTAYGSYNKYARIVHLVDDEYVYSIADLAKQCHEPKTLIEKDIEKCMSHGYLVGYLYRGDKLEKNFNRPQAPEMHTVACPYCGANVNFAGESSICPYCGGVVKYTVPKVSEQGTNN